MNPAQDDSKRCPECRSTNLRFDGQRDHVAPTRDGEEPRVVARTIHVRCGRCGATWDILRRVAPG